MDCKDEKCPVHGSLRIRGKILTGIVVSDKPKNTVIVECSHMQYIPKFERYERRNTKIAAHKPVCMAVKVGEKVKIGECRKLSKTKTFAVLGVEK